MVSPMDMPKHMNKQVDDFNTDKVKKLVYSTNSSGETLNNFSVTDFTPNNQQIVFWYRCYRKQRYRSRAAAEWLTNYYKTNGLKEEDAQLDYYKCDYCLYYHVGKNVINYSRNKINAMHDMRRHWNSCTNRPDYIELMEAFANPRTAPNARYARDNEKFKKFPGLWKLITEGEM